MLSVTAENPGTRIQPKQENLARIAIKEAKNPSGKTKKQMMLEAGYSISSAQSRATRAFEGNGFKTALTKFGFTQDKINKVFDEAAQAKTVVTYKGDAIETDAPDHKTRLQAVSLLGDFTGQKIKNINVQSVNVNLNAEDMMDMLGE